MQKNLKFLRNQNITFKFFTGIIRNQNVGIDQVVHQTIRRLDINILVTHIIKIQVVQKKNIVEEVLQLVVNLIIPVLHVKLANLKVLKHQIIVKKIKVFKKIQHLLFKLRSYQKNLKLLNLKIQILTGKKIMLVSVLKC